MVEMTDEEIVKRLIKKDERVTRWFFYEKCRPLLISVMRSMFRHQVDYDEVVDMVWLLLMENDAQRLRNFGFKCSLCQWLKVVCKNYLSEKKGEVIGDETDAPEYENVREDELVDVIAERDAKMDVESLFAAMKSLREVYVIRRLMLEDAPAEEVAAELNVTVDYLYVIKQRALKAMSKVAMSERKPDMMIYKAPVICHEICSMLISEDSIIAPQPCEKEMIEPMLVMKLLGVMLLGKR